MPSLINSAMENGTGPALGAAAWGYLFFFCSYWSKRIGSDSSEPPYWLYGSTFGAIRWISLAAFLVLGWFLGSDGTLLDDLFERSLPIGLAVVAFGPAAAVALGLLEGYRRLVAVRLQADHEPMSPGRMIIIICAVAGGLGIIAGGAWTLREFFNVEIPEPQKLISELNVGILLALVTHFVLFWIIPIIMADRFEEQDLPTVWAKSTGLEYFRWAWLGLSGFAFSGIAERVPGLESMLNIHSASLRPWRFRWAARLSSLSSGSCRWSTWRAGPTRGTFWPRTFFQPFGSPEPSRGHRAS